MSIVAFADRSGVIEFGQGRVPRGMLPLYRHRNAARVRDLISATARHAYDGRTLLVPGVPEAASDDDALDALIAYRDWIAKPRKWLDGRRRECRTQRELLS